jgi:drug/metabolite transporter (DMT)-like permease
MKPSVAGIPVSEDNPVNREPSYLAGLVIALICASFGANATAIKISLTGLGVFTAACLRFTMASVAISLWALFTGKEFRLKRGQAKHVFLLTLIFVSQISLYNVGLKFTHASRGTLLSNLQPFFVLLLAHFIIPGDRITLKKIMGIVCGFIGVSFILFQKEGVSSELKTGDLLTLASVGLWAVNAVYTKKILVGFKPFQLVLYPGILSIPFFFIEALIWDDPMVKAVTRGVIISMLYQGIVTASIGFVVWMELLNRYGAVAMHSYVFILPVAGVFFGGLVLGEPVVSGHILLSLFFIVLGIVVVHSRKG